VPDPTDRTTERTADPAADPTAADLTGQLRPITAEQWAAFADAMNAAFAEEPDPAWAERPTPVAELDRSLARWDGERVVCTAGIYSRELAVPGAVVPCAGVTWVTVSPTHRRRGLLTAVMRRQLTELHEQEREPVAALWAAESAIYGRFGYAAAAQRGGLSGRTADLRLRPGTDLGTGRVELVGVEAWREPAAVLYDRLYRAVPGLLARDRRWWDRLLRDDAARRRGAAARRFLLHREAGGEVTGAASYQVTSSWTEHGEPEGTVVLPELWAATPQARAALWRFVTSLDLVRTLRAPMASADDPVRAMLADPRALHATPVDALWVRLVDVGRALSARRYPAPVDLVLGVRDPFCAWNDGAWRLWGHPSGAYCDRTDRDPDLVVDVDALAAAYLGGVSLATLHAAGRVTEVSPGAVTQAATAFRWPVTPWCPEEF
jgi:predicted acetyltransferase